MTKANDVPLSVVIDVIELADAAPLTGLSGANGDRFYWARKDQAGKWFAYSRTGSTFRRVGPFARRSLAEGWARRAVACSLLSDRFDLEGVKGNVHGLNGRSGEMFCWTVHRQEGNAFFAFAMCSDTGTCGPVLRFDIRNQAKRWAQQEANKSRLGYSTPLWWTQVQPLTPAPSPASAPLKQPLIKNQLELPF